MKWKVSTFAVSSMLVIVLFRYAGMPEPGRLIDLADIPQNVICETVARNSSWYIITVPIDGTEGHRAACGVYYFGKRLPQYFFRTGDKIQAVKRLSDAEPIEWPDNPNIR